MEEKEESCCCSKYFCRCRCGMILLMIFVFIVGGMIGFLLGRTPLRGMKHYCCLRGSVHGSQITGMTPEQPAAIRKK